MSEITSVIPEHGPGNRQINIRRLSLKVVDGPDQGLAMELDHDVVRIGAHAHNHFVLTDTTVSRRHAEITRVPDGLLLRDLSSTNGTFVGEV